MRKENLDPKNTPQEKTLNLSKKNKTDQEKDSHLNQSQKKKQTQLIEDEKKNHEKPTILIPKKGRRITKKTVQELKNIILESAGPEFFEFEKHPCDLELIQEHYQKHGYKPKEHGYIELKEIYGDVRVIRKTCLVALFVKLKLYHKKVEVRFREPLTKPYAK